MKPKRTTITVFGKVWKVIVLPRKQLNQMPGWKPRDHGETDPDTREIHLCLESLNEELVIHELVHVYYDSICTGSANINQDDFEEISAEMFAKYGKDIIKLSDALLKELNQP